MTRDNELWRAAMRGVRPLAARKTAARSAPSRPPAPPCAAPAEKGTLMLDRRRFARAGGTAVEARLDLHGLTQEEAHRALTRFIEASARAGLRQVLVITGKGRQGEGVLRGVVPRWLAEDSLRGRILAASPAAPRDGGSGALYLRLRRAR
jgi:DNA-nicking Smr family endonuclease